MVFPDSVLSIIFQYLPLSDKLNASLACKQWRNVCVKYLCLKRGKVLDSLHFLVGTLDNSVEPLILKFRELLPQITIHVHNVFHFDDVSIL